MNFSEKCRQRLDQGLVLNILLTVLSKALEYVSHELPSAKLNVKLKSSAVRLIFGCLTNKKQQTKSSCQYSSWKIFVLLLFPKDQFWNLCCLASIFMIYLF